MTETNLKIDLARVAKAASKSTIITPSTSASTSSSDSSWTTGIVTEIGSGGAWVDYPASDPQTNQWGPTDGTVYTVPSTVLVELNSSGQVMKIGPAIQLSPDSEVIATGAPGQAILENASQINATQSALAQAQEQLDAAQAKLNDPDTGLEASQSKADDALSAAVQATQNATTATETAQKALDTAVLRIDSSRGLVFKNSLVSTVLTVTVIRGGEPITNIVDLQDAYGAGAYLEWSWKRLDESDFGVLSSADSRISGGGFTLTVSPDDVDTKVVFMCSLNA